MLVVLHAAVTNNLSRSITYRQNYTQFMKRRKHEDTAIDLSDLTFEEAIAVLSNSPPKHTSPLPSSAR